MLITYNSSKEVVEQENKQGRKKKSTIFFGAKSKVRLGFSISTKIKLVLGADFLNLKNVN